MLEYLYTGDFTQAIAAKKPSLHHVVQVYQLSDKYLLDDLQAAALDKFETLASIFWATPAFAEGAALVLELFHDGHVPLIQAVFAVVKDHAADIYRHRSKCISIKHLARMLQGSRWLWRWALTTFCPEALLQR